MKIGYCIPILFALIFENSLAGETHKPIKNAIANKIHTNNETPFEFKGLPLGSTEPELMEKFKDFRCRDPDTDKQKVLFDRHCVASSLPPLCGPNTWCSNDPEKPWNYAGIHASSVSATFLENKLFMISVSTTPDNFDTVKQALSIKYGEANDLKTESIQTNAGVTYQNEMYRWKKGESSIIIKKYAGNIKESSVSYSIDSAQAISNERKIKQAQENAGKL